MAAHRNLLARFSMAGIGDLRRAAAPSGTRDDEAGAQEPPGGDEDRRSQRTEAAIGLVALLIAGTVAVTQLTEGGDDQPYVSDDFNSSELLSHWTVEDPVGDGEATTMGQFTADAWLQLAVPAGEERAAWGEDRALRAVQDTRDGDFGTEVAFVSLPAAGQAQGLVVEQDDDDWVAFESFADAGGQRVRAITTVGGESEVVLDEAVAATDGLRLRVERDGDEWVVSAADGAEGTGGVERLGRFTHEIDVRSSGPYAATTGDPAPGFLALVDYVRRPAEPAEGEDSPTDRDTVPLDTGVEGGGTITRSPDQGGVERGQPIVLTAEPLDGWRFAGWAGDAAGTGATTRVVMDERRTAVARFEPDTTPPVLTAPQLEVTEAAATLRWTTDEPASSTVEVGTTPDHEMGEFGTPYLTRDHAVTLPELAPGTTYHYVVRSADGGGLAAETPSATFATPAASGPALDVWQGPDEVVGGDGRTQSWVNVGGNASDPQGVASITASVNGGAATPLTVGPDGRRLQQPGDFNAEVTWDQLGPGDNRVVITATDGAGQATSRTVTLRYEPATPALPYATDWAAAGTIGDQAQVVDGHWALDGDAIRIVEPGYDRIVAIGDPSWANYEVTVPVTIDEIGPGANGPNSGPALVGIGLHWQGHTRLDDEQPARHWYPTGALGWLRLFERPELQLRGNDDDPLATARYDVSLGRTYLMKARAQAVEGGVRYQYKFWPQDRAEPAEWMLTVDEPAGPTTGGIALIAHHVSATYGNVTVTPLP